MSNPSLNSCHASEVQPFGKRARKESTQIVFHLELNPVTCFYNAEEREDFDIFSDIDAHMCTHRRKLLDDALVEAIKRNPHPAKKINRKLYEPYWLEAFSKPKVNNSQTCIFLCNFQLEGAAVKFDYDAVANEINIAILNAAPAKSQLEFLSNRLSNLMTKGNGGDRRQPSRKSSLSLGQMKKFTHGINLPIRQCVGAIRCREACANTI